MADEDAALASPAPLGSSGASTQAGSSSAVDVQQCPLCNGPAGECTCESQWKAMVTEFKQLGVDGRGALFGSRVQLHGLEADGAELNGLTGTCGSVEANESRGGGGGGKLVVDRYAVTLDDGRTVSIATGNLKPADGDAAQQGDEPAAMEARLEARCASCGKRPPAGKGWPKCQRCKGPRYCGRDCQQQGWQRGHKASCKEAGGGLPSRAVVTQAEPARLARVLNEWGAADAELAHAYAYLRLEPQDRRHQLCACLGVGSRALVHMPGQVLRAAGGARAGRLGEVARDGARTHGRGRRGGAAALSGRSSRPPSTSRDLHTPPSDLPTDSSNLA